MNSVNIRIKAFKRKQFVYCLSYYIITSAIESLYPEL